MDEVGSSGRAAELEARLERLGRALSAQQEEIVALRMELRRLREPAPLPTRSEAAASQQPQFVRVPVVPQTPVVLPTAMFAPAPPIAPRTPSAPLPPAPEPPTEPDFLGDSQAPVGTAAKPAPQRSVENRIGSQWFSRVGIVALLTGVALFLKLAIDNHWIHPRPSTRVAAGLLLGAAVVLWSERFRRKGYATFSYSLKAIGTGTLYLVLWASFQMYHLWPAWVALTAMIGVTAWNAAMAWLQDSELLAVYALVGGFATPALLGSGGNHETFLFSYLLAMDVAVLVLIAKKPWQRLLFGAFPGTVVYFIGWYVKFFTAEQAGLTGLFVVLLAAPFAAVALIGQEREDAFEGVLAPLSAASFLALAMYSVLEDSGRHGWLAWAAVALAAVYLLLMRVRRGGLAEPMHLALAIIFLTIAIPLKAEGRWITIGWLAEGVVLLWVAARLLGAEVQPRVRTLLRRLGCGALALGVIESLIFWVQQTAATAFWNGRFWTEMAAVGALALGAWIARQAARSDDAAALDQPQWPFVGLLSVIGAHLIAALAVARELNAFWGGGAVEQTDYLHQLCVLSIAAFLMVYGACLVAWLALRREQGSPDVRRAVSMIAALYLACGLGTMLVTAAVGDGNPAHALWNERMMFELCGVAALGMVAWFARLAGRVSETGSSANWPRVAVYAAVAAHLLAALAGVREINTWWETSRVTPAGYREELNALSVAAWLMVYGAVLLGMMARRRMESIGEGRPVQVLGWVYVAIGSVVMIVSPLFADTGTAHAVWNARLLFEGVGLAALAVTAALAWRARREIELESHFWVGSAAVSLVTFNVMALLAGVHEITTYFGVNGSVGANGDAGLAEAFTISAWLMVYAAGLLAAGFWRRMAFVRWQGLGLLVFTIGKVFLYDVRSLGSIYRILSFFGLGIVLMTVSFAYQKDWLGLRETPADPDEAAR